MSRRDRKDMEEALDKASRSWSAGDNIFVHSSFRPQEARVNIERLNDEVNAIAEIGWELFDTALVLNTTGMNHEVAMFTFVRPRAA